MEKLFVFCIQCNRVFTIWDYVGFVQPLYSCPYCDHIGNVEIATIPKFKYIGYVLNRSI